MWSQFLLENIHFAINVFGTLAFFCIFWLYWDAWKDRKAWKESFSLFGFLFLSFAFIVQAIILESTILVVPVFTPSLLSGVVLVLKSVGYIFLITQIIVNPITKRPEDNAHATLLLFPKVVLLGILQPILSATTGYLFLRRATVGLENHLKRIGFAFFLISISDLFGLAALLRTTTNVQLYQLSAPFGPFWILQHVFLFFAFVIFARWGFSYLFQRFESQMFMIFTSVTLAIFLITTLSFTSLLLKNIQESTTASLEDDAKILMYTIDSKKAETLSDAQVFANNTSLSTLMSATDKKPLKDMVESFLLKKKESSLVILDSQGMVLARGEERDRVGDSLSSDPLVKRALLGQETTSLVTKDGVLAPDVNVVAVSPIRSSEGTIQGVVMTVDKIDNAFLDNIKSATGFEVGVYGGQSLSATSVKPFANSNERALGVKESNQAVKDAVLGKGNSYVGTVNFLSSSYLASYMPLKDADNSVVGMLFVGSPEVTLLQTASRSIEYTFILSALLLVLSIIPSRLIAHYISKQL